MSEPPWKYEFSHRAIKVLRGYGVHLPSDAMPDPNEVAAKIPLGDKGKLLRQHDVGKKTCRELVEYVANAGGGIGPY